MARSLQMNERVEDAVRVLGKHIKVYNDTTNFIKQIGNKKF